MITVLQTRLLRLRAAKTLWHKVKFKNVRTVENQWQHPSYCHVLWYFKPKEGENNVNMKAAIWPTSLTNSENIPEP